MFNGPFGGDLSHLVVSALLTALQLRYWTTVVKYDRASSGHVIVFNGFSAKNCWRKRKKKRKKGEQRTHKSNNRVRHQKGDRRQFPKKRRMSKQDKNQRRVAHLSIGEALQLNARFFQVQQ